MIKPGAPRVPRGFMSFLCVLRVLCGKIIIYLKVTL